MARRQQVAGVLVLASVLIGWGVWRVAPHQLNGDEWSAVGKALLMLFHDPAFPQFRKGGNLHLRVLSLAFAPLAGYWYLTGQFETMVAGTVGYRSMIPLAPGPVLDGFHEAVLVARVVSVLAAVGTVYLTYRLGRELAGHQAGAVAAITLLAAPGFVTMGKFANEDPLQYLLVVATLWLLAVAVREQSTTRLLLAAATMGLAVSAKATAGLLVVPLALTIHAVEWRPTRSVTRVRRVGTLAVLISLLAYFATTPAAVLHPAVWFVAVLRYVGLSLTTLPGARGYTYQDPGVLVAGVHLAQSLGLVLFVAALTAVGVVVVGLRRGRYDRRLWLLLTFAGIYAAVLFAPRMPQYPRLVLLHPILAVCVGIVVDDWWSTQRRRGPKLAAAVLAVAVVLTLVSTAAFVADFGTSRSSATSWLSDTVEPGDAVDTYGYRVYLPEPPPDAMVTRYHLADATDPGARIQAAHRVERRCPRYVVLSSYYYGRFFRSPAKFPRSTALVAALLDGTPDYRRVARFGPPVATDYSLTAKFRRSANYPPVWLWGNANPTVVILERRHPPSPAC